MKSVLFLCTGNYYRSRFAEILFNRLAANAGLDWRADSRGLRAGPESGNVGPISRYAVEGLRVRGIAVNGDARFPLPLSEAELSAADLVVAVKEAEHRPLLAQQFPDWADRVEYWHVDDLDCSGPEEALARLESHVVNLLLRLRQPNGSGEKREIDVGGRRASPLTLPPLAIV
jgi:protein-tyrosine phosphatase